MRASRQMLVLLAVYVAAMAAIAISLHVARGWTLRNLSSAESRQRWQQWTADERLRHEDPSQPVRRKVPTSDEPPLLVLMRDVYPAVLISSLVAATVLFALAVMLIRGRG